MLHRGMIFAAAALALAGCPAEETGGITVTGTVVSRSGGPIAGAEVYVGRNASVTTGADGRFEARGVGTPYDVVAVVRRDGRTRVARYEALTIAAPRIAVGDRGPEASAQVSGTLSGHPGLPGHEERPTVCGQSPVDDVSWVAPDGAFGASITWDSGRPESVTIHAISYAYDASGLPTGYDGLWSSGGVEVSDGATVTSVALVPAPLSPVPVTVSYDGLPAGWEVAYAAPTDRRGTCRLRLPTLQSPPASFTYLAPDATSSSFQVAFVARNPATYELMNAFADFALQLGERAKAVHFQPGVTLLSPEPLAWVSPSTRFLWSSPVAQPLSVFSVASGIPLHVSVVTNATASDLAWLARVGIALPGLESPCCDWSVVTHEARTVDEYAQLEYVGSVSSDWEVRLPPQLASGIVAVSEPRYFFPPL